MVGTVVCDVEVENSPAPVGEDQEAEQHLESRGRYGEEVDRDEVTCVAVQKNAPARRGRLATPGYIARNGGLGKLKPKLEQLAVDSRSAPEWVRGGHLADQGTKLWIYPRSSWPSTRLALPVATEALPVPTNYGRRLNQDEHLSPAVPEPPEADPDKPICGTRKRGRPPEAARTASWCRRARFSRTRWRRVLRAPSKAVARARANPDMVWSLARNGPNVNDLHAGGGFDEAQVLRRHH